MKELSFFSPLPVDPRLTLLNMLHSKFVETPLQPVGMISGYKHRLSHCEDVSDLSAQVTTEVLKYPKKGNLGLYACQIIPCYFINM